MNPSYGLLFSPQRGEMFIDRTPYTPPFPFEGAEDD
jgi:hypothetical protein